MKRFLLLLAMVITPLTITAQTPSNGDVTTATEITSFPFSETNIRLDLASNDAGGQGGCSFTSNPTIYYKFTATRNAVITAQISDSSGSTLGFTNAIFFTAPDLNASGNSQLQVATFCGQSSLANLYVTQGQSYYVIFLRVGGGSSFTDINFTETPDVPNSERNALIDLYNATNGSNWTNNTNWNTNTLVSTWFGLSTQDIGGQPHVTFLSLGDNNLEPNLPASIENLTELQVFQVLNTSNQFGPGGSIPPNIGNLSNLLDFNVRGWNLSGTIPTEIGSLSALTTLDLRESSFSGTLPSTITNLSNLQILAVNSNNFSGTLPNVTALPLSFLRIQDNLFEFGDFENEFSTYQSNINIFTYAPQKSPAQGLNTRVLDIGGDTTLNSEPISGNNNTYQWLFNGQVIPGENQPDLSITNFQSNQSGNYLCQVSNTVVTGLTINAGEFEVGVTPSSHPDYNALVAIYNNMTGDIWNNNANWLDDSQPISTWYGITETNGRVTRLDLNTNQLQGNIPSEIGELTMLDYLDLRSNFLFGNLPDELGNLQNATWLDLRFNQFDGMIPASIATIPNLFVFIVSNNNFSGTLPDFSAQSATTLDFLWIENNQFVFTDFENEFNTYAANISTGFVYNPQQFIDEIDGIAANIGDTVTLNALPNLGTNVNIDWYTGDTFELIGNGASIDITVNTAADYRPYLYFVTSPIVTGLGLQSQNMTIGPDPSTNPDYDALLAIYNALDGPNWTNPWDLTKPINFWDQNAFALQFDETTNRLTSLDLGGRGLSGTIPPEIGDLTELTYLSFFVNDISGEVPPEIWNLTQLTDLFLGAQESRQLLLSSGIPATISNLQNLVWLNLTGIPLTQPLQPELFNLPNLLRLRLELCGLSGTLPEEFAAISDVRLNGNDFVGPIPSAILNSTGNQRLAIANNYFNFTELEPLVTAGNYDFLEYSPQRTLDEEQSIDSGIGADITLTIDDTDIGRNSPEDSENNVYQWFKDDVAITGADENTYTIFNAQESDSGIYYCQITNPLLPDLVIQRADITLTIDGTLSVQEEYNQVVKLYPNPTKSIINISIGNTLNPMAIKLFDMNGRLIITDRVVDKKVMDISSLQSGIYIMSIENDQGIKQTKRIIKQ